MKKPPQHTFPTNSLALDLKFFFQFQKKKKSAKGKTTLSDFFIDSATLKFLWGLYISLSQIHMNYKCFI